MYKYIRTLVTIVFLLGAGAMVSTNAGAPDGGIMLRVTPQAGTTARISVLAPGAELQTKEISEEIVLAFPAGSRVAVLANSLSEDGEVRLSLKNSVSGRGVTVEGHALAAYVLGDNVQAFTLP